MSTCSSWFQAATAASAVFFYVAKNRPDAPTLLELEAPAAPLTRLKVSTLHETLHWMQCEFLETTSVIVDEQRQAQACCAAIQELFPEAPCHGHMAVDSFFWDAQPRYSSTFFPPLESSLSTTTDSVDWVHEVHDLSSRTSHRSSPTSHTTSIEQGDPLVQVEISPEGGLHRQLRYRVGPLSSTLSKQQQLAIAWSLHLSNDFFLNVDELDKTIVVTQSTTPIDLEAPSHQANQVHIELAQTIDVDQGDDNEDLYYEWSLPIHTRYPEPLTGANYRTAHILQLATTVNGHALHDDPIVVSTWIAGGRTEHAAIVGFVTNAALLLAGVLALLHVRRAANKEL